MHNFKFNHKLDSNRIKQDINSTQLLVNGYFDLVNYCNFTPYVGAGLGVAYNQAKDYKLLANSAYQKGAHKTNFAWNIGAGAAYKFTQNFALDLSYKFHDLGKVRTSNRFVYVDGTTAVQRNIQSRLKAHAVTLGVRYTF
jgi:opacity protein-like surface antigen